MKVLMGRTFNTFRTGASSTGSVNWLILTSCHTGVEAVTPIRCFSSGLHSGSYNT